MGTRAAAGAAAATPAALSPTGAAPNAGATANGLKQRAHQAAAGATTAAQPGHRAVDTSVAIVISIDNRQPQVDPLRPEELFAGEWVVAAVG
jgi:hypothetical protein